MSFDNTATLIGNITADPELNETPGGAQVVNFSIAVNRRWKDRNGEDQEQTSFVEVVVWSDLAVNVSRSLSKGDRAIVIGRFEQQSWDDKDTGKKRSTLKLIADEVSPSLRWATASVSKVTKDGNSSRSSSARNQPAASSGGDGEEPF